MAEAEKKNYTSYILVALLVGAAFVIGNLYTKVKTLEKGATLGVKEGSQKEEIGPAAKTEIKINDDDPSMGPKDAKVTLVVFSDFLCPYCGAYSGESKKMVEAMKQRDSTWEPALSNIIKNYVDSGKVRVVWKDTPFHGSEAITVHAAGRCAADLGKFWEFHNYVFSLVGEDKEINKTELKKIGQTLKLDANKFNPCVDSDKYNSKIQEALSYAQSIGVEGTPATFVNGKLISGAVSYLQFKTIIEEELKK